MPPLHLATLGTLELRGGGDHLLSGRRKELVLLAYLAREAPRKPPRSELAELLWERRDEQRARHSFRQALLRLKREIGDGLLIGNGEVGLRNGAIELDASLFEDEVTKSRFDAAAERWSGDFLHGLEDVGGEAYRQWLEGERSLLRRRLSWALEQLTDQAIAGGAWTEAARWGERWVRSSPSDETAHVRYLEALLLSGRGSEAVARCDAFTSRLASDGLEPSAAFHALGENVRRTAARAEKPEQRPERLSVPDMVGRVAAFADLTSAWTEVEGRGSALIVIHGEEGIGKTRLCQEFVRWLGLRGRGVCLLEARARETDQSEALATLRRLLAALPGATGLGGAPDDALAELVPLVPGLQVRFPRLPTALGSQVVLERALRTVLSDVAAEVPILLLLDDLPLADQNSRQTILALLEDLPSAVLVLLTGRTHLLEGTGDAVQLRKLDGFRDLRLAPLTIAEVLAQIESTMTKHTGTSALAERLCEESGGNPRTVLELIRAMTEARLLARDKTSRCWIPPLELDQREIPLPGWMREAWRTRILDLDGTARTVLEAASTLGRRIDPVSLETASGLQSPSFSAALDALIARGLLRETNSDPRFYEIAQGVIRRIVGQRIESAPEQTERSSTEGYPRQLLRSTTEVVILPLAFEGTPHHSFLEERGAELIGAALNGPGGLRCADARTVMAHLSSLPSPSTPDERKRAVALYHGARWLAEASVLSSGDNLRVILKVTSADSAAEDEKAISVDGSASDLLGLLDRTAMELLIHIRGIGDPHLAASLRERPSLKVLKSYLAGESALRRGELDAAIDFYRAAIADDPEFALGYHRLADALEWTYHPESPRWIAEAVSAAANLLHRLPEVMRVMVRARHASIRGAAEEAIRLFRSVVSVAPDNAEAWYGIGFNTFHFAQLWGGTVSDARHAFEQVLLRRPDAMPAAAYLASIAAVEKKADELLMLIQKLLDHDQRSVHVSMRLAARVQLAYGLPDLDLQRRVLEEVRHGTEADLAAMVLFPLLTGDDLDGARRGILLMTEPGRSPEVRATGHALLAAVELARGRWRASQTELRHVRRFDVQVADEYWALFACSPLLGPRPDELSSWRKRIARATIPTPPGSARPFPFAPHAHLHPVLLGYAAGLIAVPLRDWEAAEAAAESLDQVEDINGMVGLGNALAQRIRARSLAARGFPEKALEALSIHTPEIPWHWLVASGVLCGALERFLRAEQLIRLGRLPEAKRWLAAATGLSPYDVVLWAPVALKRGEIAEAEHDYDSAAFHYGRFLSLWSDCDPELQPVTADVVQRLDRVENRRSERAVHPIENRV